MARVGHPGHFEVRNVVLRGRRRTSDTLSCAWHAWDFLQVAERWQSVGQNERCFWSVFSQQALYFMNLDDASKSRYVKHCETVVGFDLGHVNIVAGAGLRMPRALFSWHAQYFVDLDKKVAET